jgi:hypothetical protein
MPLHVHVHAPCDTLVLCVYGDATVRDAQFPMLHAPEAFAQRWLHLHGIGHGQQGENVSVLPDGVAVLIVRDAKWPREDCRAASRKWVAVCLGEREADDR